MTLSKRQRLADSDMRYLAKAWRLGFDGPSEYPHGPSFWHQIKQQQLSIPVVLDSERVNTVNAQWLRTVDKNMHVAAVLKLHYRDGYKFNEKLIEAALDMFSLA